MQTCRVKLRCHREDLKLGVRVLICQLILVINNIRNELKTSSLAFDRLSRDGASRRSSESFVNAIAPSRTDSENEALCILVE